MDYSVVDEIRGLQNKGYLFHGSPNFDIKVLEPRQADDEDKTRVSNIDKAVFASDNLVVSIAFSLVDRESLPSQLKDGDWEVNWDENGQTIIKIPIQWKSYVEKAKGCLYVLSRDTFSENNNSQFKSKVSVKPYKSLEVSLNDYLDLGGLVEWVDDTNQTSAK